MNFLSSFISIASLMRIAASASLLLAVADCHSGSYNGLPQQNAGAQISETPSSAFDFVNSIGINTHLNYFDRSYGNFPFVERELKTLGVHHLRDGVHLQNTDYNTLLYSRWVQLGRTGIRFDAVFDPRSNLGAMNSSLLDKVDAMAGHVIDAFEGPNEMDISGDSNWPATDRNFQTQLFDAMKSSHSARSVQIIAPSLAFASHGSQIGSLSDVIDLGNLHPYPAGAMPSVVFPQQIDLERVIGDSRKIVFTETGYHNAINEVNDQPGISETAAAKYIPRLFLEDFAHGIVRTYLYELLDEAPDPSLTRPQFHWGLIRADGSEKPAFHALKNLIEVLRDDSEPATLTPLRFALNTSGSEESHIHHLLLEKSDGTYDLVLWKEVPSYDIRRKVDVTNTNDPVQVTFAQKSRDVSIFEPVTQEEPIRISHKATSLTLNVTDQPVIVEISF